MHYSTVFHFFVTIWIIKRALASSKTSEYIFHLSLDLVIAILATLWVLFVFSFGGWIISIWESAPEELIERGNKYTTRAVQALKDPTGRENAKNIYFGLIMGVSAALPTSFTSSFSFPRFFRTVKTNLSQPKKKNPNHLIDRLPKLIIFRNDMIMKRRSFIKQVSGISLCLPAFARSSNIPYIGEIGLQLYTLRKAIAKDLPKTLEEVAEAGYRQVEPYGFPSLRPLK